MGLSFLVNLTESSSSFKEKGLMDGPYVGQISTVSSISYGQFWVFSESFMPVFNKHLNSSFIKETDRLTAKVHLTDRRYKIIFRQYNVC